MPKSYTIFQEVVAEKARELQGKQLPAMIEVQELYDLAREANCQIDDLDDFFQVQEASNRLSIIEWRSKVAYFALSFSGICIKHT